MIEPMDEVDSVVKEGGGRQKSAHGHGVLYEIKVQYAHECHNYNGCANVSLCGTVAISDWMTT